MLLWPNSESVDYTGHLRIRKPETLASFQDLLVSREAGATRPVPSPTYETVDPMLPAVELQDPLFDKLFGAWSAHLTSARWTFKAQICYRS